jgi:hypothetical protein
MPGGGRVTVDDSQSGWSDGDAARLTVMTRLRRLGFTEFMLRDDSPSYTLLQRIPADQWALVFDGWERLWVWRQADPWWQVEIRAKRT